MAKIKAVFVDRDGTIGGGDKVLYPGTFRLYPNVLETIKQLKRSIDYVFTFTNQPGIARGDASCRDFEKELRGFGFDHIYLCPHSPQELCECRKPGIGMLKRAAQDHGLHLENCMVIGDRWTDMLAAQKAGCPKILVKTGAGEEAYHKYQQNLYTGDWCDVTLNYVASDLTDAVNWLKERDWRMGEHDE